MIKYFQNRFALSEKGAKDLWRSIAFSTLLNFALRWGVLLSGLTTIAAMMTFMKIVPVQAIVMPDTPRQGSRKNC